jgi:hypothetical protein
MAAGAKRSPSKAKLAGVFVVHLPNAMTTSHAGSTVSVDVRYGSLVILDAGVVSVAYAPGEWLRVNVQ